jgi:hypothetical protein
MEAGGTNLINHALRAPVGLLLPMAPGKKSDWAPHNQTSWAHIDPMSGQRMADYQVPDIDCVRMNGKYLIAYLSSFSSGFPVVWDTERRTRIL